jgi:PBP1b-binding outer membrane lipoprotein LpoB
MNKVTYLIIFAVLLFTGCSKDEPIAPDNGTPIVKAESSYTVLTDEDVTYAKDFVTTHQVLLLFPFL